MSKWELPPKGGYMESAEQLYVQNMTWKDITERLKTKV